MHCPSLPAIAHDRHVPSQAVAQQTPVTQKPDAQSPAAVARGPGRLRAAASVDARGAADAVGAAGALGAAAVARGVAHVRAAGIRRRGSARARAVAARGVAHRRVGARLRAADRSRAVQRARAGPVAGAIAPAAGRAFVGTVFTRIRADRNVRARADAAFDGARLTRARAVRSAADAVEAEAGLAVSGGRADAARFHQRRVLAARRPAPTAASPPARCPGALRRRRRTHCTRTRLRNPPP